MDKATMLDFLGNMVERNEYLTDNILKFMMDTKESGPRQRSQSDYAFGKCKNVMWKLSDNRLARTIKDYQNPPIPRLFEYSLD
jgi:hypothetical protein